MNSDTMPPSSSNATPLTEAENHKQRHTGTRGTLIKQHHALRSLTLGRSFVLAVILLPLLFDGLLWVKLDSIIWLWERVFHFWVVKLGTGGQVLYTDIAIPGRVLYIPFPNLPTSIPSLAALKVNLVNCVLIFIFSVFIPKRFLPLTYLLRALLVIQISASVYFFINPDSFPYDLAEYISDALVLGIYLMFLVPLLLAMIYYIFDFALWKKIMATTLIIGYFIIFLPFQYMMHAFIISSCSLLFMPVLYLFFGLLLDTLMFVALYAWAMSWRT